MIFAQIEERLTELFLRLAELLPDLLAALFVMLLGWLLARLGRMLVGRTTSSLLAQLTRLHLFGRAQVSGLMHESAPRVVAETTFWLVFLVFAAIAVDQLRIEIIAQLFARLTQYLPDLAFAIAIVLAGFLLASAAGQGIESTARRAELGSAVTMGRLAQAGVMTAAALVAADQIGVESTLLIVAFAITVGSALGAIALAFGIGSGPMVGNLIAARNVRKVYRTGQLVRIGAIEGRILEVGSTMVAIDTSDGTVQVPASRFGQETSVLLKEN